MKKLFWENPYLTRCEATVTKVDGNKIYLDQTVFFAFSGGQASDKGTINGLPVLEAILENGEIGYVVENPNLKVGDRVEIKIDGEHRRKIMKLHTAAHITYYVFVGKFGKRKIIGSNITAEKGRIDFIFDRPITEKLSEIEKELNDWIKKGLPVETWPDENDPDKRWWKVEGLGQMPCGGTHVKSTAEIGQVKLKRRNIGAGKERIEITLV